MKRQIVLILLATAFVMLSAAACATVEHPVTSVLENQVDSAREDALARNAPSLCPTTWGKAEKADRRAMEFKADGNFDGAVDEYRTALTLYGNAARCARQTRQYDDFEGGR